MQWIRRFLALAAFATLFVGPAHSQERGTKDEAIALVNQAFDHVKKVGVDQALKDFTTDKTRWVNKDLHVFAYNFEGVCIAHGANDKLIGKSLIELKDQNGKQMVKEMVTLAQTKGVGWVDYDWAHPQTKKVEGKSSYLRRIPGFDGFVAVGIYR